MDTFPLAAFLILVGLVVIAAWEYRPKIMLRALPWFGVRRIAIAFLVLWLAIAAAFVWLFHAWPEFWELLALLAEIAGVVYLAREVHIAQSFEEYDRTAADLQPIVDLESLARQGKYEEYVTKYYELGGGRTREEVQRDITLHNSIGDLGEKVEELASHARRTLERPKGLAAMNFRYRRNRLMRGIVLVTLGLAGHGIHVLASDPADDLHGLRDEVADLRSQLVGLAAQQLDEGFEQRIHQLEVTAVLHRDAIGSIVGENKRWHVARRPSAKRQEPIRSCSCSRTTTGDQSH